MTVFEGSIHSNDLRDILDAVTVLVDECRVSLQDDKMVIRGTDPGDVALVVIEIPSSAFDDVEIDEGDVCWDFSEMKDMISTVGSDEEVHLEIKEHDAELDILDLDFTLTLLDPNTLKRDREKPQLDLPAEVSLQSSAFKRGINAAELVADYVEFGIDDEKSAFYMEAKGDDNEVILERTKSDLSTLTSESVNSTYSVDYLEDICDAIPNDVQITINLGDDFPAEISFNLLDGDALVTYFISPRLEAQS